MSVRSRRLELRSGLAIILAVLSSVAALGARDVLSLGSAGDVEPGQDATIPLRLRDRAGTALDNDGPAVRTLRQLAITVRASPAAAVESIDFVRAGATADLEPAFETRITSGDRETWLVSFPEAPPVPTGDAAGRIIANLVVRLAPDAAPSTTVDLELVGADTVLSNGAGTVLESEANGHLKLENGSIGIASGGACVADGTRLCLLDRRFALEVRWKDFQGSSGTGKAVSLTTDSGYFWFFNEKNVEIAVKTLDGTAVNGHFWVFFGSLTNVEFELEVTDTATDRGKVYRNPPGNFASQGDTLAFTSPKTAAPRAAPDEIAAAGAPRQGTCTATARRLCLLGDRFALEMSWKDFQGNAGPGFAVPLTSDSGYFWFFNAKNVELVVKTLDGTRINGHYWVFFGSMTNVEFELAVTDTMTGTVKKYKNPPGSFASAGDTTAF